MESEIVWLRRVFIYERDNNQAIQETMIKDIESLKNSYAELEKKYTEKLKEVNLIKEKLIDIAT